MLCCRAQVSQQRRQAGGAGGDRHAGAGGAHLCPALSQLLRQSNTPLQPGEAQRSLLHALQAGSGLAGVLLVESH